METNQHAVLIYDERHLTYVGHFNLTYEVAYSYYEIAAGLEPIKTILVGDSFEVSRKIEQLKLRDFNSIPARDE